MKSKRDAPAERPTVVDPMHPDHIVGGLTRVVFQIARPVPNTLAQADVYRGRSLDELFPAVSELPDVTVQGRWRVPGLVSEDLVFRSQHVPLEPNFRRRYEQRYPELHLVYARRIRPSSARQRPRLLYLHGYMQPETYIEEFALLTTLAVALDVEVIQMQMPHHGRRASSRARFSGELFCTADLVRSIEALRQTMLDARALLGWLTAEDDRPVGISGLSLGGAMTSILTCLDARLAFSIPLIAHMDLAALVRDAPVLSRMRRDLRRYGWDRTEFARFVGEIGWESLGPKVPPGRTFVIAAANDRFFEPSVVEEMWQRWGRPAIQWYPTSHMGFLPYLPDAVSRMRRFIDAHDEPAGEAAHARPRGVRRGR